MVFKYLLNINSTILHLVKFNIQTKVLKSQKNEFIIKLSH
jgi:hypothetical protein